MVGTAYSQTLKVSGINPALWSVFRGSLPAGLSLGASSGVISGTPTTAGSFLFTVGAATAGGSTSQSYTITVASAAIVLQNGAGGTSTTISPRSLVGLFGTGMATTTVQGFGLPLPPSSNGQR